MRKGIHTTGDAAYGTGSSVGRMFDRIAPTYDFLNHLFSFGCDWSWRRKAAGQLDKRPNLRVVDLATGTGDMLISLLRARPGVTEAVGLDVSRNMLVICRAKLDKYDLQSRAELVLGDASASPFPEEAFDAATMAFGIRNTADVPATLREVHRILRSGGTALILEFSLPARPVVRWFYLQYLRLIVPLAGGIVSRDRHAYRYLDESIEGFHQPQEFLRLMAEAGFHGVSAIPLTFGVASIYTGTK